jgi:RNA polymerase sigma-B factor
VDLPEPDEYHRADVSVRWPGSRDITVHALLSAAALLPAESSDRASLRKQAIEDNIAFASRLARRFRDRGEPVDDLSQVAMVGLVNAVDGYDPSRGCEFAGYATPTIVGEIRRYFRDKGWRIKVPRRLQELRLQVNRAKVDLSQTMSASPTNADIARHLGVSEVDVAEAIEVSRLYNPVSLSAPAGPDTELGVADPIGDLDPGMEAVDNRESVKPLLASLPARERKILTMRFFSDMTQSQIASELGISQMHVSRLLSQTLLKLRGALVDA